ncbi:MAG: carboxypeptidase regulatory-like domain-containing protein, partial [Candidatus Magasanikbacteria bacterium]|nr:carboxypeptidase regulatory-like domain-containing protein [Candidatus Magasanikbacteria bacterium]
SACFGFVECGLVQPVNKAELYSPPGSTVPNLVKLAPDDVVLLAANNQIILLPNRGTITAAAGVPIMAEVPRRALAFTPELIVIKIDGQDQHQLKYDAKTEVYYAVFTAPATGAHRLTLEVTYTNKQFDAVLLNFSSLASGSITGEGGDPLSGVVITLTREDSILFPGEIFGQANPLVTNVNGTFVWMVKNGAYTVRLLKDGYYERVVPGVVVTNNVINGSFSLIKKPPLLTDGINPNASFGDNFKTISSNALLIGQAKVTRGAQFLKDQADDPAVEKAATRVVAPASISVVAVGTLPFISFADVVPLMRFLFLQPLMLLQPRKRSKWGQVYNALTKLPVDLATVRLINNATGRVIQSKVTDAKGRYAFVIDPGEYRLEVVKNNVIFPSILLKNFKIDGSKLDIYHGELVTVNAEQAIITANIPLDPADGGNLPKRFYVQKLVRQTQSIVAWVGLGATLISLYISPRWYVWALLGLHLTLTFLFHRLSRVPKVKGWGIMYDANTKQPVAQAVARLFSSQFNKLVGTQITDRKGRYYFLAGESQYFVTGEHRAYRTEKSHVVDLKGKSEDTVAVNLGLSKAGSSILTDQRPSESETISNPTKNSLSKFGDTGYALPPSEQKIG